MLRRMMAVALLVGLFVILFHPDYRDTARAIWRGEVEESAIWESNKAYYSEVARETDVPNEFPE